MSDTYEFLKAQKDAIIAKQDAELAEWLTAASEDISHYRRQLAEAKAKIESLQAAQTEAVKQTEGLANLYTSANNLLVFIGREGSVSTDSGPISALSDAMYELDGGTLLDDAYFQTKDQKGKAMIELPEVVARLDKHGVPQPLIGKEVPSFGLVRVSDAVTYGDQRAAEAREQMREECVKLVDAPIWITWDVRAKLITLIRKLS